MFVSLSQQTEKMGERMNSAMNHRRGGVLRKMLGKNRDSDSFLVLMLAAMLCSSCATIISGSTAQIQIDGNVDEPVTIVTSMGEYHDLSLPATVKVRRRSLDGQHIQINSESYAFSDIILRKSVNPWAVLDAVPYGIPLVVDLLTNAASEPEQSRFFITPDAPRAQADSLHRADSLRLVKEEEEQRQVRLRARQLPKHYYRHEWRGSLGFGRCQAEHDRDRMLDSYMRRYELETSGECFDIVGDAYLQAGMEYHYRLNRKWDIGVLANWGISREGDYDYYPLSDPVDPVDYVDADELCRFFVVAPSLRYTWYEISGYRCYSRIALGLLRHHLTFSYARYPWVDNNSPDYVSRDKPEPLFIDGTDKIKWRMAYQLTALGVSLGSDNFHLFGELGYGSLGIVRVGLGIAL